MSMKNPNDTIGNQTRDFPACSKMPQLNTPLRQPGGLKGTPKTCKCPNYSGVLTDTNILKATPTASDHIVPSIQRWKAVSMEVRNAEKVKLIW
jgi:hypothetical protein